MVYGKPVATLKQTLHFEILSIQKIGQQMSSYWVLGLNNIYVMGVWGYFKHPKSWFTFDNEGMLNQIIFVLPFR